MSQESHPSIIFGGEAPEDVEEFVAVAGLWWLRRSESGVKHERVKSV